VPFAHELADADELSVGDLQGRRCPVCHPDDAPVWCDFWSLVAEHGGDQGHRVRIEDWPGDAAGQVAALVTHQRLLTVPASIARAILAPGLRAIPVSDLRPAPTSIATAQRPSPVAELLLEVAEATIRTELAAVPALAA